MVDHVADYLFDGDYLLVAEDGENLRTRKTPVAFIASGKFWANNHAHVLRGNELANTYYLAYAIERLDISGYLTGSTQPKLTQAALNSIRLNLPKKHDQDAIVAVLRALDDKIAINDRVVSTGQELMISHYEKAIARGSRHVPLGEAASFSNNQRIPLSSREREARPGPYPYYGAAGVVGYVHDFIFSGPRLLVGEDGSVITPEGRPVTQYVWGEFWVNNHAHVLTGTAISTELLSVAMKFTNVAALVTGAVQPKLSMSNLRRLEVPIPEPKEVARLEAMCGAIHELLRSGTGESRHLTEVRDTLLPELMSGRLRVKDAEKVVEEAI